jgi:transcriptional regulator with XRE-family HTH domain
MVAAAHVDAAVALLHVGIDPDEFLPVITTQTQLLGVVDGGSVLEWRHHLSMIVASPWSPYARHLVDLAAAIGRSEVAAVVEGFTELCRDHNKEHEREQVAEEVRRLISASGITQREFAKWVGTSPSRLSTYVSGTVTPSASLMLRMARTSRLLQEREVPQAPLTLSEQSWGAARAAVDGRGTDGSADPAERISGSLGRDRSHLSAV